MEHKQNNNNNNSSSNKNKNNENFLVRLFDIISIPLFISILLILINDQIIQFSFYFEYALYIGLVTGLISLINYGYAGYRAKKNSNKNIKPSIAGLSLGVIVGLIGVLLTIFMPADLSMIDEQYPEFESGNNNFDETQTEIAFTNEDGTPMDSNPFQIITIIFSLISVVFGGLFGMLLGFLGGKVAQ